MVWQLQEAKQKFSALVREALAKGPQIVTRHGEEVVVVLSAAEFRRLSKPQLDVKEVLLSGPYSDDFAREIERSRQPTRVIDLD
jgi:prevent-host-death family protein